jgi:hypothetical protein
MASYTISSDASSDAPGSNAFVRGFVEGAASLLDIFRGGARRRTEPEDDALELLSDVEAIAQDFHAVLPSVKAARE